ncbi:Uncharacterized conserved protein, DUF4415 family [Sphingomonas sp. YR710]|uniref:BrnA antitoxin family protein n=1 Tax=Sphingomonas sp. YR710 TaxID=1882773 RepID=UPI0008920974|nr:BrnA antitoxin family protein [Sphingomonas sp. YR710]SDD86109.1 Uncharacterized conserved protein, DUF4415 family [Sphingomonas sp. YR710]
MPRKQPPVVFDDENPEWTRDDFARGRLISDFPELAAAFPKSRGRQKAPVKVPVSLRLDQDTLERFKAGGPGWQSRINEALRKAAGL